MIYNSESIICDKIDHKDFFDILKTNGYSADVLSTLFEEVNYETSDSYEFNCVLRDINKRKKIPVFDMLLCLEKYFAEPKKILTILDDRTKEIMMKEVKKTFNIKVQKCSLSELFE